MRSTRGTVVGLAIGAVIAAGCTIGSDVVAYDLPAEEGRYTLEVETDGVVTVWEYTSSRPASDEADELQPCIADVFGLTPTPQPCRPEPLIFLRYDLGLDLDNTLRAGRPNTVTITGYHQQLESPPEVTELQLEVTFDGGESWESVRTSARGDGAFAATIRHPRLSDTNGTVGLRVTAADSGGNTVQQTVPEAYRLR